MLFVSFQLGIGISFKLIVLYEMMNMPKTNLMNA